MTPSSSSPAKAGDPVNTGPTLMDDLSQTGCAAFTGCPAFAGHDEREFGAKQ
jgi:hypothetical protein